MWGKNIIEDRKVRVNASEVGRAAFCAHSVELRYKGIKESQQAKRAQKAGTKGHNQENRRVSTDKRCFVASYLYGIDDQRTEDLRQWRDQELIRSYSGRVLISLYYRLSPLLISYCQRSTLLRKRVELVVEMGVRHAQRSKPCE